MRRVSKEIHHIERHKNAPELNRVIFMSGFELRAPNVKTVEQFTKQFAEATAWRRVVNVEVTHPTMDFLNRSYCFASFDFKYEMAVLRERHNVSGTAIVVTRVESRFLTIA